jgi:polyvinyl alcohol dehydrogenase (cytochrome)
LGKRLASRPASRPGIRLGRAGCVAFAALLALLAPAVHAADAPAATRDGAQVFADERAAKERLPGKQVYEAHCAVCHNGSVDKAPHRDMIGMMTPAAVVTSLTTGVMSAQGSVLSEADRVQVAEYLTGHSLAEGGPPPLPMCAAGTSEFDFSRPTRAAGWGQTPANTHEIDAATAGISSANVAQLKLKWSLAFPGANRLRSQPTFAAGALYVGSHGSGVYALDQATGCVRWRFAASGEVRTGVIVESWTAGDRTAKPRAFFGDILGNVYAVDAITGALLWRHRTDDHPNAVITGSPALHGGKLYVPVSSLEVALAVDPHYECCKARGWVAAYDAATGDLLWKTPTIAETPRVQRQNSVGTDMYGPSGATVWNAPTIDAARNQLYIGTGENMSSPATLTSDAIMAMDLDTGAVKWNYQATPNDVWNAACDTATPQSCPPEMGPDFDFGAGTLLFTAADGRQLVVGGQKSGDVHALDPVTGALVWKTKVGRGGIQGGVHFGVAANANAVFVPITDMADGRTYDSPERPGMHAVDGLTGKPLWYVPTPDACNGRSFCHPGNSQAVTLVGDLVLAGSMDGIVRAYRQDGGEVLWQYDTTPEHTTHTGVVARGGSFGGGAAPVAEDGMLAVSSGYGIYNHMPGNLLLVFEVVPAAK